VPFLATPKGAVERQTLALMKLQFVSGVSFNGTANRLKELAHTQFYEKQLVYYDFAASVKDLEGARRGELGLRGRGPARVGRLNLARDARRGRPAGRPPERPDASPQARARA
jgi:hypothetical protein